MKFCATTFPKTGTHLLRQILGKHRWMPQAKDISYPILLKEQGIIKPPSKNRESGWEIDKISSYLKSTDNSICAHLGYHPDFVTAIKSRNTIIIQLIRDPRDTIIAHYHSFHRIDRPQNVFNFYFDDGKRLSEKDDPLLWCIRLAPYWWKGWLPWIENKVPDMILRFEDLVGPNKRQIIGQLAEKIGPEFSVDEALARIDPNKSMTFRKGLVGEWKNEFQPHHIKLFEEIMGYTMETLGYKI